MLKITTLALLSLAFTGCNSMPQTASSAGSSTTPAILAPAPVKLSRRLAITTCYSKPKNCIGPAVKDLENANIEIPLEPFSKGDSQGFSGSRIFEIIEDGVLFKNEIRVTQTTGKPGYHIYSVIHSGSSLKRNGSYKTVHTLDMAKVPETTITDKPIKFKRGTLQAQVTIGPVLPISNPISK